jgi:hypothetical protein
MTEVYKMARNLQIFRAKPNPLGKDKFGSGVPRPEQLLGEWIDLKNIGNEAVPFHGIKVYHVAFDSRCQVVEKTRLYYECWYGNSLEPGEIARLFTGRERDKHLMAEADKNGVNYYLFANKDNFVLNNRCGDNLLLTWSASFGSNASDSAGYAPNPPEGVVLQRRGHLLVPQSQLVYRF